jgi:hypothetical protein
MADSRNVCSSGWRGVRGSTIRLENHNSNVVTVDVCPSSESCTFAFASPPAPFPGPANGYTDAVLIGNPTPGVTHCYCTSGCPDQIAFDINPKTVIIT